MEDLGIGQKLLVPTKTKPLSSVIGSYTYFAEGDVLLAKITPCFENGKLGIASGLSNGIGFGSSEYVVLRPNASLSRDWLYHFLDRESFRTEGAARMTGAVGHKRVPKEFIEEYSIPLPPLPEQQRIVGILDEAFAGIATAKANAEKNLPNARALFESHLHAVFTHRGPGWVERRLEEVCGFQNGFAFKSSLFRESGSPILRISNIQNDGVDTDGLVFFNPSDYREKLDRYRVMPGDLMIAMSGGTTGKVGFNTEDTIFYLNQRVGKFEPGPNLNLRLLYFFLSTQVEEHLRISAGSAQPNLSTEQIKNLVLPLPSVQEQASLVARLDALQTETRRLEALAAKKLAALDELKSALLHQAFSGQL